MPQSRSQARLPGKSQDRYARPALVHSPEQTLGPQQLRPGDRVARIRGPPAVRLAAGTSQRSPAHGADHAVSVDVGAGGQQRAGGEVDGDDQIVGSGRAHDGALADLEERNDLRDVLVRVRGGHIEPNRLVGHGPPPPPPENASQRVAANLRAP